MDMKVDQAPSAPSLRHGMRFEGSGGEFFKIWIVNLALTIVTLGIFSAWAKVRTKRYFNGNTFIGEHNFDYHASPLRILLGRAISLLLLLGYSATAHLAPGAVFLWGILFAVALPWLMKTSYRFNARNTSYRNIRFNFTGTYGGAFGAYILWPLLVGITLFTTLPLGRRARDYYAINNHAFGGKYFRAQIPGSAMYRIFLMGLGIFILFVLGAFLIYSAVHAAPLNTKNPATMAPLFLVFGGAYAFCVLFLMTFIGTMVFNLAISRTVLADQYQLEARLSPLAVTWIAFSNLALTLVTVGLFYPWARARMARYRAAHIAVTGPADLDGFTSELVAGQSAVGEEIASFFDIDLGL